MRQPTRNYLKEMAAWIEARWPEGDFIVTRVANQWILELKATDPDLYFGFLDQYATRAMADMIANRDRQTRTNVRRRAVSQALTRIEKGEPVEAQEGIFNVRFAIDAKDTRRRLGDMTARDHLWVADTYKFAADDSLLKEKFHREVAKHVGNRRTEDVYSEAQISAMYGSFYRK